MKKIFLTFISCIAISMFCFPQWHNKKCAVVLTYDDGYAQQLDNALPVLDSMNLKATFYLSPSFPAVNNRMDEWKKAATEGHELGNHTLYHPCVGNIAGREWVLPENNLSQYTVRRMINEIKITNVFLKALDGKDKRTFAYPCGDTKVNDTPYIIPLKNNFVAARNVRNEMHTIDKINLYDVDCYTVNGNKAEQMQQWVKQAMQTHSLLVILFHGVGGGNSLNVDVTEHSKFLHYLKQNEKDIWIAPMIDVAEYIKNYQAKNKMQ